MDTVLPAFIAEFRRYRALAENAAGQCSWEQLRTALDPETNSVAVVMKHIAGNLRSRWTEPFTTDGEKTHGPHTRDRDAEFIDDFGAGPEGRAALERWWGEGWGTLEAALASCSDADLARTLLIRAEPHTLALALSRSLAHTAYHTGQIVQTCRTLASRAGAEWRTLTVPRGGSAEHNRRMMGEGRSGTA
jgi:hypothetical protein